MKHQQSFCQMKKLHGIAGYVVLISESPFKFENKYMMFLPDGSQSYEYNKHERLGKIAQISLRFHHRTGVESILFIQKWLP